MEFLKTLGLFTVTAVAEIVGCYLPWLVLKQDKSAWLLLPAALSLAVFLAAHPASDGCRTYVRCLRWGLYRRSARVALRSGGHILDEMGRCWRMDCAIWHDDHCGAAICLDLKGRV